LAAHPRSTCVDDYLSWQVASTRPKGCSRFAGRHRVRCDILFGCPQRAGLLGL
jgi:hypothetical protein